jgi:hypothetical protein
MRDVPPCRQPACFFSISAGQSTRHRTSVFGSPALHGLRARKIVFTMENYNYSHGFCQSSAGTILKNIYLPEKGKKKEADC